MSIDINKLHNQPDINYSGLNFGDRLRAVRKARGLTYQQLADAAGMGKAHWFSMKRKGLCQMWPLLN